MILNHRVFEAAAAVQREAIRRDIGKPRDPRFDVAITMLLDLADELERAPADVDVLLEELHAGRRVPRR